MVREVAALALLAWVSVAVADTGRTAPEPERGAALYQSRCAVCHGARGDGRGPASSSMDPAPRDFTAGLYRLRSTQPGHPPSDDDLFRAITRGVPGTAMPGWSGLSASDRWALVDHLKSLSPRFDGATPAPVLVPEPTAATAEAVARGRELFVRTGCAGCHGDEGRGDGPVAAALGVRAYDMTTGRAKRGNRAEDVFVAVRSGIEGTPMPGYAALSDPEAFDLAHYVRSLSGTEAVYPRGAEAQAAPVDAEAFGRGETVYNTFCVACHGADGRGPIGANLADEPERLAKPDDDLLKVIREGVTGPKGAMPPWGAVLNETQQRDVLGYLRARFPSKELP